MTQTNIKKTNSDFVGQNKNAISPRQNKSVLATQLMCIMVDLVESRAVAVGVVMAVAEAVAVVSVIIFADFKRLSGVPSVGFFLKINCELLLKIT